MKSSVISSFFPKALLLVFVLCPVLWLRADFASDLAFTAFPNPDLNALAGGQVLQARGGLIDFMRGVTAQSLYVVDAPPADVQAKLLHWSPASHAELKVWLHQSIPPKPTAADYAILQNLPDNSSVAYLINQTSKLDPSEPSLQLNPAEAQLIGSLKAQGGDKKALMVNAWSQILAGRADHFLSAKTTGDEYVVSGGNINPLSEITSLLKSDPKIYRQYQPLIKETPVEGSIKAAPADLYLEAFDVEGATALGTGAIYQASVGNSIQSADVEYFVNYGIYASIELEELWPVTINGKIETLVWRSDMISTSNVAYLRGTERLASGMIMLQDVKQAIDAFRSEFK